tara:strand:+ start:50 stop:292 length:243 start_codon:yes stop_codon:yes gene_type:complete
MITTKDQAIQFLTTMQYLYPLFHPEDNPSDIVDDEDNRVFNDDQCKYLDDRFDEVYKVLHDPCGIIVHEIRPTMTMFNLK